jgi:diguanylate cyclase (GGDEF)-like protein/PAS domain S-box-containing protein
LLGSATFYVFNLSDVLLAIFISIICCTLGAEFCRRLKLENYTFTRRLLYSLMLGFSFWIALLFVCLSIDLPYSTGNINLYFQLSFYLCFIGSYIALGITKQQLNHSFLYIFAGLIITLCILGTIGLGFYLLYSDQVQVKPVLAAITVFLTMGTMFSLLRFLIQITNSDIYQFLSRWKFVGSILGGAAFAGIPFMAVVSLLNLEETSASTSEPLSVLIPFAYCALTNLALMLVPDLFGERLLMRNIQSYLSLFNHNPDAVFAVDLAGNIMHANKEAYLLTGYDSDSIKGVHFNNFLIYSDEEIVEYINRVHQGEIQSVEVKLRHRDGFYIDVRITPVRIIVKEELIGVYGIVRDITEKTQAEETIRYLAYHDDLTNLPNKRMLEKAAEEEMTENRPFYLFYIDFDRFKRINDTFGHFFGDKILQETGKKLEELLPNNCTIARLGGDEFAALLPHPADYERVADKIIEGFSTPIVLDGFDFLLTASIGVAHFPEDGDSILDLLKAADLAMYRAKNQGSNRYVVYESSMKEQSLNKIKIESDLRRDIASRKLTVYYQPKFDTGSNQLVGSEALIRWKHEENGFIPPSKFIPIAEESNLIIDLERFVITEVFQTIGEWKLTGLPVPRTSINISVIHFYQEDFVDFIIKNLAHYKIEGSDIEIEITESVIMRGEERVNLNLLALREVGVEISVDDFGTGYSSLSYLQKLNVDRLKIDQSFIADYESNKEIISAIISMSHNLNLKVIAEGVETSNQIGFLQNMKCFEVQGYFYSPPVERSSYEDILTKYGAAS